MRLLSLFSCLWLYLAAWGLVAADGDYDERLDLTPLASTFLLASFSFWSNASLTSYGEQHFRHIPRSLAQILQHAETEELHLRFSTGRWDDEDWGRRPRNGWKEGATGVEVWAWVHAQNETESFEKWIALNHALSGLFCASLNFIDSTRTTRPRKTFLPSGDLANKTSDNLFLLHGSLPREVVCTENLTPFLKLLPCKGQAGVASLLDGHKLFDASWQTMALDMRSVCANGQEACSIEIEQTVDMVLETERSKRPRDNPIPRPGPREALLCNVSKIYSSEDACYPTDSSRGQSWTIAEIFGRQIRGSCLANAATESHKDAICLHVPDDRGTINLSESFETKEANSTKRCYTLYPKKAFDMVLSHLGPQTYNGHEAPRLFASRSITGHGQERGGVQTILTNPSVSSHVDFVYFETLPWFMKPFIHTLNVQLANTTDADNDMIKETYYRPAQDRKRGTHLELVLSVPPQTTVFLTYEFEKAILRYTEYPPDANRGFDIPPAVIRILPSDSHSARTDIPTYIRTTSLLLPLPTPDFSMPYNVIILTSTVIALAFGSIFNLLVRRFVAADEVERWDISKFKAQLRDRVRLLLERLPQKFPKQKPPSKKE